MTFVGMKLRRRWPHAPRALGSSLAAVACAACSPTIAPRTADTAPDGELAFSGSGAPVHLGWGEAKLESGRESTEFTGGAEIYPDDSGFAWAYSATTVYELELRYGLARWAELGAFAGFGRLGVEARAALLDEDIGDPVSLAASYGAAYSAVGDGPWMRAGLDFSFRLGDYAPLLDVYVSREATSRSAHQGDSPCPQEGYPGTACGELVAERQIELRLSAAVGLAVALEDAVFRAGVVPYVPLHSQGLSCPECTGEVRPTFGVHVVAGGDYPAWERKAR